MTAEIPERCLQPTGSPRWVIEFRECGVWDTLDEADDEETAIMLASHYVQFHSDENLRISTPDYRLL